MRTNAVAQNVIPVQFNSPKGGVTSIATVQQFPAACSHCNLRGLCLPCDIQESDTDLVDKLIHERRRIRRGQNLYNAGNPFRSIYAVRSGFFKSYAVTDDGREQVTGFQMSGEIIGLDGIGDDKYRVNVEALEDAVVCVIPFSRLEETASRIPTLQHQLHRMMSREIVRDQAVMMLLGSMNAEERVIAFLLNISKRYAALGYAATEFLLRMTRQEIGSYLGLKLETVSRVFSKLQQNQLIAIDKKHVRLLNPGALTTTLGMSV